MRWPALIRSTWFTPQDTIGSVNLGAALESEGGEETDCWLFPAAPSAPLAGLSTLLFNRCVPCRYHSAVDSHPEARARV